jgi:hypothetical protein
MRVLVKKGKIPRKAVEPLMQMCEMYSREEGRPASEIYLEFLGLMSRYSDYFFSGSWPKEYDFKEATSFADEDLEFLFEGDEGEFAERYRTVCLKKNMYLEGFMGYFGMFWTGQAFHERFIRPSYEPVVEAFRGLAEKGDARFVLGELRAKFSARLIHNSLIDLLEHEYPDKSVERLIEELFDLLHTDEGLPSCGYFRCSWYWKQKYQKAANCE